jgi:hypothetical protein
MDRNQDDNLNDRLSNERLRDGGLDRSGAPDSNATSESLVGDSMRAGTSRGDALVDVDRDASDLRRDDVNPGDEIGEAVGGISGVLTGAALGSLGGPIGTIIGGIAGAVSGWWAGRAISEAASHATNDDDDYYRTHYEGSRTATGAARTYDDVRPAYQLGHIAGRNPDYKSRSFDEVETDLRHGWSGDVTQRHGDWNEVRDYARHGYERSRSENILERGAHKAADMVDDVKDRFDGNPASRPGADVTDSSRRAAGGSGAFGATGSSSTGMQSPNASMGGTGAAAGAGVGDALTGGTLGGSTSSSLGSASMGSTASSDMSTGGIGGVGDRVGNTLDDMKDRIDGNPASRPGLDATDSTRRADSLGSSSLGSSSMGSSSLGGTSGYGAGGTVGGTVGGAMDRSADALDDMKDRIDGNPASRPGLDRTDSASRMSSTGGVGDRVENTADHAGNAVENAWDKTKNAAHRAGEKIENALDDTKDRVDGNPASRPGVDRTDDRDRLL